MKKLNNVCVGFYGTPDFSLKFLEDLYENQVKISYIVTQPPKSSGRGKKIKHSQVHEWGIKNNIKVLTPLNTNNQEFLNEISNYPVDLNIVVAYGRLLSKEIINLPKYLSINVHASLLPRWRGAAPIQRAILSNDKETGLCIMRVDEKLDSGPIILYEKFGISENDNFEKLYKRMIDSGKGLLKKSILKIINNEIKYKFQDETLVTYAKKIKKKESKIIWNKSAYDINLKIRAFSPFPGAWTTFKNSNKRVKILKAKIIKEENFNNEFKTGDITEKLEVKCKKDFLKIEILQKEGKKPMSSEEFLNGNKIKDSQFF